MAGSHSHSVNTTPPGWGDVILGLIVFYAVTEGVHYLLGVFVPDLEFSRSALAQIQISGGFFLLLWPLLGNGIISSYVNAAIERETRTEGAKEKASQLERETVELRHSLRAELQDARVAGQQLRDAEVLEAKKQADEILELARKENDAKVSDAVAEIKAGHQAAESEVQSESVKLAGLIVERALKSGSGAGR